MMRSKRLYGLKVNAWNSMRRNITKYYLREKCPNTELLPVSLRIQSECGKIRARNNSVFGHFSCGDYLGIRIN